MRRALACVLAVVGCVAPAAAAAPPRSPEPDVVRFAVRIVRGSDQSLPIAFDARYDGPGSTAHFGIVLTNERVTLVALPDSHPRSLLAALKHALAAKRLPAHVRRVGRLAADCAILGYDRTTGWVETKLFFGGDRGEVYLNLNLRNGLGEFVQKDAEYGTYVLQQLARVL